MGVREETASGRRSVEQELHKRNSPATFVRLLSKEVSYAL
jgi:hypothetical protein